MRSFALLLLGLAACGPPRSPVRARLLLLDPDPVVGGPLRVRVELINDSKSEWLYAGAGLTVEVLGPDGFPVPDLYAPPSFTGGWEAVGPRSTKTIEGPLDLAARYLLAEPGRCTVRLRDGDLRALDTYHIAALRGAPFDPERHGVEVDKVAGLSTPVPCAPLELTLRPADSEAVRLAKKLLAGLPEGWTLTWQGPTTPPSFRISRHGEPKTDPTWIAVNFGDREAEPGPRQVGGREVRLLASPRAGTLWPGYPERLLEILQR